MIVCQRRLKISCKTLSRRLDEQAALMTRFKKRSLAYRLVVPRQTVSLSQDSKQSEKGRMTMPSREYHRIRPEHLEIVKRHLAVKPVPLGALARDLGIEVKLSALEPGSSGMIKLADDGYRIKINRYETRERQRFTLAHEIAHFLLHQKEINRGDGIVDNVLYRSGQPKKIEHEANRLAADLIMPDEPISSDLERINKPITEDVIEFLAREWRVSKATMEVRLGLVSA